ncbi:hypothetical protein [Escherichia coli]|uniref:hypothetical protein n=1 Tax=Escherichia coli TaxID=562 RepID=UPI0032B53E43
MTTTIYREFEFAACDSKWSVDGHLRRDVIEKKAIHIDFKGKEAISLMCGDHPMIVLMEPRQPGGCKLKTAPVRPVVAARPAEYVCSEDLFY